MSEPRKLERLRRSRKVIHFCSIKVTHLENRVSVSARIIIHAAGVCICREDAGLDIIRAKGALCSG